AAFVWGRDLASAGDVYGLGLDAANRSLIITYGGPGTISGQWFDLTGAPMTGAFTLLTGFQAGQTTGVETAPLIGGGVAVRRVDQQDDAGGRPYRTAQWLATSAPTADGLSLIPPKWLSDRDRKSTRLN